MRYSDIPVHIGENRIMVTYDYVDTGSDSQACTITADGRVMVIDEHFSVKNSNMPDEWVGPIIDKLKELIAGQGF